MDKRQSYQSDQTTKGRRLERGIRAAPCINIWEDTFKKIFKRAQIDGHSHQLRHTFAVNLLQKGVSMENVSVLLGHRKMAVTEKYYAQWVKGRQDSLEKDVRKTWK